jgi:tetratricopeptide (TPR) repeat protein
MSSPIDNLTKRFCPPLEPKMIASALAECDGHAGRAAKLLRELSKEIASSSSGGGSGGGGAAAPAPPAAPPAVPAAASGGGGGGGGDAYDDDYELDPAAVALATAAREANDPLLLKGAGNAFFSAKQYDEAVDLFGAAIKLLKVAVAADFPGGSEGAGAGGGAAHDLAVIYSNRAAAYLSLKSYVRAGNDARLSAELEPTYWKAHWRRALALQGLSPKIFRTKEAITALEMCLTCTNLPTAQRTKTEASLTFAQKRLQAQEDATPLPEGCALA